MAACEGQLLRIEELEGLERAIVIAPDRILKELGEVVEGKRGISGAVFPGVVFDGKVYHDRVVAIQCDFEVYRGSEVVKAKGRTLLTFFDGWSEKAERLLENVYGKLGNRVVYLGGGAGSLEGRIDCLFIDGEFFRDDAIFFAVPERFNVAVRHGWTPMETSFIATKSEGRKIIELDWEPAFEVYASALKEVGAEIGKDYFFDVAKSYPFGVSKLKGEEVVRDPLAVEGNSIVCAGIVHENSLLRLMRGEKDSLLRAAESCLEEVGSADVVFDCVSRVLYLGEDFEREARLFRGALGSLTIGEVACERGFVEVLNKTVVAGNAEG